MVVKENPDRKKEEENQSFSRNFNPVTKMLLETFWLLYFCNMKHLCICGSQHHREMGEQITLAKNLFIYLANSLRVKGLGKPLAKRN